MAHRERADILLVKQGLVQSRARAQDEIKSGHVRANGTLVTKAGDLIDAEAELTIENQNPWVSRSALKLIHALDHFNIDPKDKIVLDIGASTGGFTQVCLARAARRVYAIDVGQGQLSPIVATDQRVVSLEKTDSRNLLSDSFTDQPTLIVCDVSFISLEKALVPALDLVSKGAILIALIKPQFEAGPENVGKGGIVHDIRVHEEVVARIRNWLGERPGWQVIGVTESPIEGGDGNKEFLIAARRS